MSEFEEGSSIIEGLVSGEMSRDQFIRRATLLGISATAIGGMLAATGKATAADLGAARSLAGSTVNLLVAAEGDEKGVRDKIGEMKKRFGIDVKMTALAVGPLIEKSNQSFKAPTGTYDAVMVLANGAVMDKAAVTAALGQSPPWKRFDLSEPRVIPVGADAAALVKSVEQVPDIPMFRKNTAAFVHEMPAAWNTLP